jgi:hypothetical protein
MTLEPLNFNKPVSEMTLARSSIKTLLSRLFPGRENIVLTEMNEVGRFHYDVTCGGQSISAGNFNLLDDGTCDGTVASLFRPFQNCLIECRLSSSRFIFHELTFPEQLSQLVDKLLVAQLEQFIPWPSAQCLFGRSPIQKVPNAISVVVAAAPRYETEQIIETFASIFEHRPIQVYALRPEAVDTPILINTGRDDLKQASQSAFNVRSLMVVFLLVFTLHMLLLWRSASLDEEIRSLSAEIHSNQRISDPSESRIKSFDTDLIEQKRLPNSVTFTIDEFTGLLPDHTWIRSYQHVRRQIRIEGWSRDAAGIIGILERSGRFSRVEFIGAVEKRREDGIEMFHIQATLKGSQEPIQTSITK